MSRSLPWLACAALALAGCASPDRPEAERGLESVAPTASGTVAGLLQAIEQRRTWSGRIVGTVGGLRTLIFFRSCATPQLAMGSGRALVDRGDLRGLCGPFAPFA